MTNREKLIKKVRDFLISEVGKHVADFDSVKMNRYMKDVSILNNRLPKFVSPSPRVSSQRKLFL